MILTLTNEVSLVWPTSVRRDLPPSPPPASGRRWPPPLVSGREISGKVCPLRRVASVRAGPR